MNTLTSENIVDFIEDIFVRRGAESYLGEACTMSSHMLQGAALAERNGEVPELVAAALLHDIGHYANEFPEDALERGQNNFHEVAGAKVLAPFFPKRVVDAVANHVDAKRYLCAVDDDYYDTLSDASKHTLNLQGGPMTSAEVSEFESRPHWQDAVAIRYLDDAGKQADVDVKPFDYYRPLLQDLVDQHQQHPSHSTT